MYKNGESKTTQIMMATVPPVTSGSGLRKFLANGFLLNNGHRVFPGGKVRLGRDADPLPPSSAEIKNRVELYLYSP